MLLLWPLLGRMQGAPVVQALADSESCENSSNMRLDEQQYLSQVRSCLADGAIRGDRTGTGVRSLFGLQARYSLRDGSLPLLTTKSMSFRYIVEELLWCVRGSTNAKELHAKGVPIWNAFGERSFLDKRGLHHLEEGDLGPVYGFQWRHYGAKYVSMHTDYSGQGVDQLARCLQQIRHEPTSRRIVLSAWDPASVDEMSLPPCPCLVQFYVNDGSLSCQLYQRSGDMGLGVPYDIASYALLTHMMAHVTGLQPDEFVHTLGDAHVYSNHVEVLEQQLLRQPRPFPKLKICRKVDRIEDFKFEDFELVDYNPHPKITLKLAV